jgi:hypothetical protein
MDKLHVVAGCCLRLQIKWLVATFPRPLKYPRRAAGRKGASGVAMRWRQRHPCPRHHDEHRGQDQGNGQEQGRTRQMADQKSVPSVCPTGQAPTVFHG